MPTAIQRYKDGKASRFSLNLAIHKYTHRFRPQTHSTTQCMAVAPCHTGRRTSQAVVAVACTADRPVLGGTNRGLAGCVGDPVEGGSWEYLNLLPSNVSTCHSQIHFHKNLRGGQGLCTRSQASQASPKPT